VIRGRSSIGLAVASALVAAAACVGSSVVGAQAPAAVPGADAARREVFARYCVSCHTEAQKTAAATAAAPLMCRSSTRPPGAAAGHTTWRSRCARS